MSGTVRNYIAMRRRRRRIKRLKEDIAINKIKIAGLCEKADTILEMLKGVGMHTGHVEEMIEARSEVARLRTMNEIYAEYLVELTEGCK